MYKEITLTHFTSLVPISFKIETEQISDFVLKLACIKIIHL